MMRDKRAWGVFAFALAVRVALIHLHPAIFGGDTVLRLANRDKVLLAYQLPVLQAAIYGLSQFFDGLLAVRYFMALTGALAAVGFYKLAAHFVGDRAAVWAALLFASSPFLVQLSIVPYQEVPMLAALLFAFSFFLGGNFRAASAALGIACLTRYEAWAAVPVMAAAYYSRTGRAIQSLALFGWAPLGWMLVHQGFSAPGTFVVELPQSIWRVMRYVYLGWITVKNTPVPVLVLGAWGMWALWKAGFRKHTDLRVPLAFLLLFTASILFSAHGESPDPERFVTAREAHLFLTAVVFGAGFALRAGGRAAEILALAGILLGVYDAHRFTARDTSVPATRLSYELAQFLDANVRDGERVAMLVKPLAPEAGQSYIDKVRRRGGERGVARALEMMAGMDTSPPDYQRTRIHSTLGGRIMSLAPKPLAEPVFEPAAVPEVEWIAVWSDHVPGNAAERQLRDLALGSGPPVAVLSADGLSAAVYGVGGKGGS
jgi:hypothetical protein